MLDDTLVIGGTEFGRTPAIQTANETVGGGVVNGRDHNHYGFSLWMAGGGIKGGITHGATDDFGYKAVEKPMHVHDLHATILYLLGIDHTEAHVSLQRTRFPVDRHGRPSGSRHHCVGLAPGSGESYMRLTRQILSVLILAGAALAADKNDKVEKKKPAPKGIKDPGVQRPYANIHPDAVFPVPGSPGLGSDSAGLRLDRQQPEKHNHAARSQNQPSSGNHGISFGCRARSRAICTTASTFAGVTCSARRVSSS